MPSLRAPGIAGLLDIAVVSAILYLAIMAMRRARARRALLGLAAFSAAYFLAREIGLRLTERIFQGFFAAIVIAVVVIFQPELRRLFERLAAFGLGRNRYLNAPEELSEVLARIAFRLAERRFGAILIVPGRDPLDRHLEGGHVLDGKVSEPLLLSLFDPTTEGHDGAAILDGDRVARFSVHLPLSQNFEQIGSHGTRHAAAIGLSERTDAFCIVVSEERGKVCVARYGELRVASREELAAGLRSFLAELDPGERKKYGRLAFLRKNLPEKALAVTLATVAWFSFTASSDMVQRIYQVPIVVENLPQSYALQDFTPAAVEVVFRGLDQDFELLDPNSLMVRIDAYAVSQGQRNFRISEADLRHPASLSVVDIRPTRVQIRAKGP
ncbi:MAG: DNA integrity scanning protein DisA nucleotide-binding domain protein [Bryobacteraceae bacterium]|nr:DNA integrity scanning protein DisA nucleotide-binding domain protein [Bryobacteraceae bacterium]